MVGVVVLFLLLVLCQTEVAQSIVPFFKKYQNGITSKFLYLESILVIVSKKIYGLIYFSFCILIYFTFLLSLW